MNSSIETSPKERRSAQAVITSHDVIDFVARNHDRLLPTIGGQTKFQINRGEKKTIFTPIDCEPRDELDSNLARVLDRFNKSPSYKTTRFTDLTVNSSYLLGMFWELIVERRRLAPETDVSVEEKEILSAPVDQQKSLRQARNGQGQYRKKLIGLRKACYVTGIAESDFLRASHIRPWSECDDNAQRLDEYNGLLLSPNLDVLFDKGYISFEDDGQILISSQLRKTIAQAFGVPSGFCGIDLGTRTKGYLAYHRSEVFKAPAVPRAAIT